MTIPFFIFCESAAFLLMVLSHFCVQGFERKQKVRNLSDFDRAVIASLSEVTIGKWEFLLKTIRTSFTQKCFTYFSVFSPKTKTTFEKYFLALLMEAMVFSAFFSSQGLAPRTASAGRLFFSRGISFSKTLTGSMTDCAEKSLETI